jgi:hypothetical protein
MGEHAYPPVVLSLNGGEYPLRLTLRAMRLIREHAGEAVFSGGLTSEEMLQHLGVFLWATMGSRAPSIEDVEEMVDVHDIPKVMEAVMRTFGNDMPEAAGEPAAEDAEDEGKADAA